MPSPALALVPSPPPQPLPQNASGRARFSTRDDIAILLEVININPFSEPARWFELVNRVNILLKRSYTVRSVRERVDLISGHFVANERKTLQKSGTEEEYSERDRLLQQVVDLMKECGHKIKKPITRKRKPLQTLQAQEYESSCVTGTGSQTTHLQRADAVAYRDSQSMGFEEDAPEEQEGNGAQGTVFDLINQMCTGQPDVEEDGPSQRATESPPAEEPPTPPETRAATGPPPAQPPSPAETRPPITPPPTMQTPSVVRTAPMRGGPRQNMVVMEYLQRRGCQDADQATRRSAYEERLLAFKETRHGDEMRDRMEERRMWADAQAEERRIRAEEWREEQRIRAEERAEERRIRAEERAEERRIRAEERAEEQRARAEVLQILAEERRSFAAQQETHLKLIQTLVESIKK